MSQQLISHSPDLQRLLDDGYDIDIADEAYLLVRNVPYINAASEIKRGTLVEALQLADMRAVPPTNDHTIRFIGEMPCDQNGQALNIKSGDSQDLGSLRVNFAFSCKRHDGQPYADNHEKITTYVELLQGHAQAVDPNVSATDSPPSGISEGEESVFLYPDTATTRAGIGMANRKLKLQKVAIAGLGGSGSYVLDLVAKTPVNEIHLYDDDDFLNHNAYRAPGAASHEEVGAAMKKVEYFANLYSRMRRKVVPHPYKLDSSNVAELTGMDFTFICVDAGPSRALISEHLEAEGTAFVDVGLGLHESKGSIFGHVRTTTSTDDDRQMFRTRAPRASPQEDAVYDYNIQVADLNALNATLAVIRWKKLLGYYRDTRREHNSIYDIDGNMLVSEGGDED